MNTYQVLFLTNDNQTTATQFESLHPLDGACLVPTYRSITRPQEVADFDLIVIDAEVEMINAALESCKRARANTEVPILIISSLDDEEYAIAAYQAGADDYIVKPFSSELLRAKLQAWLRWTVPVNESLDPAYH